MIQSLKVQMSGLCPGGMLKFRVDRRITPLNEWVAGPQAPSFLPYICKDLWVRQGANKPVALLEIKILD